VVVAASVVVLAGDVVEDGASTSEADPLDVVVADASAGGAVVVEAAAPDDWSVNVAEQLESWLTAYCRQVTGTVRNVRRK
jgi:hypothetical protein